MRGRVRTNRERGAVAVMVSVLFSSMVLIGCAALTIDLGRINAERRGLQNSADAAALSLAQDCATTSCTSGALTPQSLADDNAMDDHSAIGRVDGGTPVCGPALSIACPTLGTTLRDCVQPPTMPASWVRVYTRNLEADGVETILPYTFGKALTGDANAGKEVQACAQAGLSGGYDPVNVLPITQSLCAWEAATDNGTDFPPLPPYSASPELPADGSASVDVPSEIDLDQIAKIVVMTDPNGGSTDCGKDPSTPGHYTPGNFGWLDEAADCKAISVGATIGGTGGVPASTACTDILPQKVGTVVYLPITNGSHGTGQGTVYDVAGVAAFYLAGVDFEGNAANKLFNGFDPMVHDPAVSGDVLIGCDKTTQGCLWGWYLEPLIPGGSTFPGGNFGPTTISLLG